MWCIIYRIIIEIGFGVGNNQNSIHSHDTILIMHNMHKSHHIFMERELWDTCCVLDVLDGRNVIRTTQNHHIVLCRQVLKEVKRKRGLGAEAVLYRMRAIFGHRHVSTDLSRPDKAQTTSLEDRFGPAHRGDSAILELGRSRGYCVVTRDRGMRFAAMAAGVVAVLPFYI